LSVSETRSARRARRAIPRLCTSAAAVIAAPLLLAAQGWTVQNSGVTSQLRGVSAVDDKIVFASGSASTIVRTLDGGETWLKLVPPSEGRLDYRDIDAVGGRSLYALSIGNGPLSRIYKSTDLGTKWTEQFKSDDPKVFLDAMTFWDATHGIVVGDSIDGQFFIMTTEDGATWTRVPAAALPPALTNEGAFAASGTAVFGPTHVWFGTGAGPRARVLHSSDRGRTWQIAETPIRSGRAPAFPPSRFAICGTAWSSAATTRRSRRRSKTSRSRATAARRGRSSKTRRSPGFDRS
jgi:hypothetical protein